MDLDELYDFLIKCEEEVAQFKMEYIDEEEQEVK